jgi:hypothetical protein
VSGGSVTAVPRQFVLPSWRGEVLESVEANPGALEWYDLLGVCFATSPDDEVVDYLEQVVGYAWTKHMRGAPPTADGRVSVHDSVVVFDANVRHRTNRTRSRTQATHDLIGDLRTLYREGSPIRRDGGRLIDPPVGVSLPDVIGYLVGVAR